MTRPSRRTAWTTPSLSRDFTLLTAAILFVMLLISAWVAWVTYLKHSELILDDLRVEAGRIDRIIDEQMQDTGFLLAAAGKLIAAEDPQDLRRTGRILRIFADNKLYAGMFWTNADSELVVHSGQGVLSVPVNVSDRDYIQQSVLAPGVEHIGAPIEGRVSKRWVIPVGYGVSDNTGKFLGTVSASIDIDALTRRIGRIAQREGISFSIISPSLVPLTTVAESQEFVTSQLPLSRLAALNLKKRPEGEMSRAPIFGGGGIYAYYLASPVYPYIIVVGYDSRAAENAFRSRVWPPLLQIAVVACFLLALLWIVGARIIRPVVDLSEVVNEVASGRPWREPRIVGPQEVSQLASHLRRVSDYLTERRRVEGELHGKISVLLERVAGLQMDLRSRAALFSGLLTEYRQALRHINSYAQALKDQLFGPLENKKYRQYAADIYHSGTALELMVRKLIALSRMDGGAVVMREETVELGAVVAGALRYAAESLSEQETLPARVDLSLLDGMRLLTDPLHLQQALAALMLYLLAGEEPATLAVQCRRQVDAKKEEGRMREHFLLLVGSGELPEHDAEALAGAVSPAALIDEGTMPARLHLSLAAALLEKLNFTLTVLSRAKGKAAIVTIPSLSVIDAAVTTGEEA